MKNNFNRKLFIRTLILAIFLIFCVSGCAKNTGQTPSPPRGGEELESKAKTEEQEIAAKIKKIDTGGIKVEGLDIPPRYPEFSWENTMPYALFKVIFSDGNQAFSYSYSVDLEGKMWSAEQKGVESMEAVKKLAEDIKDYYDSIMLSAGWTKSLKISGRDLDILTIDGPERYLWAYVKKDGDKFRAIMPEIATTQSTYPCDVKISLLVADIVDYDEVF